MVVNATAFSLVRAGVVGATGFEPVTSSVSAKHKKPLCRTPFSQVTSDRSMPKGNAQLASRETLSFAILLSTLRNQ